MLHNYMLWNILIDTKIILLSVESVYFEILAFNVPYSLKTKKIEVTTCKFNSYHMMVTSLMS